MYPFDTKKEEGKEKYCNNCGLIISWFRDNLSKEEYFVSGMCQSCQDIVFGTKYSDSDFDI